MNDPTVPQQEHDGEARKPFWRFETLREIGMGHLIRLGVLVLVVLGLLFATLHFNRRAETTRKERQEQVAAALQRTHAILGMIRPEMPAQALTDLFASADELLATVSELDPDNEGPARLAVPLCYACGELDTALGFFNELDVYALSQELAALRPGLFSRADRVLAPFEALKVETASPLLTRRDRHYIRACGYLWGLARDIVAGAENDTERALRLARWVALHVLPVPSSPVPADPYIVIWRGYADADQAAWLYAELARQAGLAARILVPAAPGDDDTAGRVLVEILPEDAAPLLVDPHAGVCLMDLDSGTPLTPEQLADGLPSLHALPGGAYLSEPDRLRNAERRIAVAVEACLRRMLVFDFLLAPLPLPPRIGFDPDRLGNAEVPLWEPVVTIRDRMTAEGSADTASLDFRYVNPIHEGRRLQLRGLHQAAHAAYVGHVADLTAAIEAAETEESAATLREALEYARFCAASNALDGGEVVPAERLACEYLEQYGDGVWRTPALLVRAEALAALDRTDEARAIWDDAPASRRLFAALRSRGLLAGPPARPLPPPPAAETDQDAPAEDP